MKSFCTLLLTAFISLPIFAQTDMRSGRHIFNFPITLPQVDLKGAPVAGNPTDLIKAEYIFYVRTVLADKFVIEVAKFTGGTATAAANNAKYVTTSAGVDVFYLLTQVEYNLNAERLENRGSFTVGAATTLIKVRPGSKDPIDGVTKYSEFGNDFNFGVSAGWKIKPQRKQDLFHSFVGGLSFSSVKVTPYTTQKYIAAESTQSCITFTLGYLFEFNKFQIGFFPGIDLMSGEIGRKWIYKNRPWFGLGFGYSIFRAEGEKNNTP
jgi:hypothetical protein